MWKLLRWKLLPVVSRIFPEWLLRFLHKRWPVGYDPADGWTYWLDASYHRYVRKDKRQKPHLYP